LVIAGAFAFWCGFLLGILAVISIGTTRYPNYFVNVGRSSFLEMVVGLRYQPFLTYSIALMVVGVILAGAGFLLRLVHRRPSGGNEARSNTERQPNQAL
jgi:hypothetical protein